AFGMYVIQSGDTYQHPVTFELTNTPVPGSTRDVTVNVGPGWGAYSYAYLGIIDTTPFNSITMIEPTITVTVTNPAGTGQPVIDPTTGQPETMQFTDASDGILFDNLTVAVLPTPEPSTFVLAAVAVAPFVVRSVRRAKGQSRV